MADPPLLSGFLPPLTRPHKLEGEPRQNSIVIPSYAGSTPGGSSRASVA